MCVCGCMGVLCVGGECMDVDVCVDVDVRGVYVMCVWGGGCRCV